MFKTGIAFHYNVSNIERTIAFYTEKLGFCIHDYNADLRQARLYTNNKDCLIGFAEMQPVIPSSTCITFEVDDIEQAVQIFQSKGVHFNSEIVEVPNTVKLAPFSDPDGYSLMLYAQV
ncbi:MAG: VOC family protein [Syntrophomonas sp.]